MALVSSSAYIGEPHFGRAAVDVPEHASHYVQNINGQEIKGEQMLADLVHCVSGRQPSGAAVCPGPC